MDVDVEDNIHDGGEEVCLRDGAEDGDEEDFLHDDVFSQACLFHKPHLYPTQEYYKNESPNKLCHCG
jgi:hypothetical protein